MSGDPLDVVRARWPVGAPSTLRGHPEIDARSLVRAPRRPAPIGPRAVAAPRRPTLEALRPWPDDDALSPTPPASPRPRALAAIAAALVAIGLGAAAVFAVIGGDEEVGLVGGGSTADVGTTGEPPALVTVTGFRWGAIAATCEPGALPCYEVEFLLSGFAPSRFVSVRCVVPGGDVGRSSSFAVGRDGSARASITCPDAAGRRSIRIEADGVESDEVRFPDVVDTESGAIAQVTFTTDRSAVGEPGCTAPACRRVDVTIAGFPPASTVAVTCHGERVGSFSDSPVVIGSDGTTTTEACYFGDAGERFWVEADGVRSEVIIWPEP